MRLFVKNQHGDFLLRDLSQCPRSDYTNEVDVLWRDPEGQWRYSEHVDTMACMVPTFKSMSQDPDTWGWEDIALAPGPGPLPEWIVRWVKARYPGDLK